MSSALDWPFPGSRWWKFDFHTHTPASSDYGAGANQFIHQARTPREWISDFLTAGIQCVAVTDHNCGDWIDPLKAELARMRAENVPGASHFHLFPGVELTINGAHYLAIFDPSANTQTVRDLLAVAHCNNAAKNAEAYCTASVGDICDEVRRRGGLFIPAHVDEANTGAFKVQTNLSAIEPILRLEGVMAMEVRDKNYVLPASYTAAKLKWASVLGSDSHHPVAPAPGSPVANPAFPGSHFTWVKMAAPSLDSLRLALIDGDGISIRRSDDVTEGFDPYKVPDDFIEGIGIHDARYMGLGGTQFLLFSPWLNALVGGRGTGKSTVVHFLRLTLRREGEARALSAESQPRREFERFNRIARGRDDEGGLRESTVIKVMYRHQGARYRVTWRGNGSGHGVEVWEDMIDDWIPAESQEVKERFPLRIFSQGQIAALAGERSEALLGIVNQAVGYTEWKARWDDKEREFFSHRNRIRELEGKLLARDRIVGQLDDVRRKLARFEEAEHAKVLKAFQSRRRQAKELHQQAEDARGFAERIRTLANEIAASDVPEGVFDPEATLDAGALEAINRIRDAIAAASAALGKTGTELLVFTDAEVAALERGEWQGDVEATKEAYDKLVADLQTQGVQDPSEYGRLVQDRQRLEGEVKALDSLVATLATARGESEKALGELQTLRREISERREQFLTDALSNNSYVRIGLERYGRDGSVARDSLRSVLGIDGNPTQFEQDIFRRAENGAGNNEGVIGELLANLPGANAQGEIEGRLEGLRSGLVAASLGGNFNGIGGHLKNRLVRNTEQRPEFVDRILTWYPEDTLSVSFSPKGDGSDFRPIQQGSAGQRAAAMLAFLLAYGGEPIVVDQPEDDLDNHLIYQLVVRQMRSNKQRRQIITVTHNPNIVVNGDAEMVHAFDFIAGQCKVIQEGSLQDAAVRQEICRVMEGGEEAFEQRYRRIGKGGRHV
jgi:energy-coupling factor transporter ATP-binding protein EcfA2